MSTNNSNFNIKNGLSVADKEVIAANGRVYVANTDLLSYTQAAFDQANTGGGGGGSGLDDWARIQANSAFDKANTGTTLAQAAFNKANTGCALPSQSGHSGQYLQTNGSTLCWSTVSGGGGGGGLTPYTPICISQANIVDAPETTWKNLGNVDEVYYYPSTYFQGITPTSPNRCVCQLNSANNVFVTAPYDAVSPNNGYYGCWNEMWLIFSSGRDTNFANTTYGQAILGLTPGNKINTTVKWIGSPWWPDLYNVELTVTRAAQDLYTAVSSNSSPSTFFSFSVPDDPNNTGATNYPNTYNPYTEVNSCGLASNYVKPGQKIIVGFCNPLTTSFSKSLTCGCTAYDWNFGVWDYSCGSDYRTYYPYVFAVRSGQENWWLESNWSGITSFEAGIKGGTIVRIDNSAFQNKIFTYNGQIGSDNGANIFGTLCYFNNTSNNFILTSSNITSSFTTSNTLQHYTGTNFTPGLVMGCGLKITENPFSGNTTLDGHLYKTLNYQSLGEITGTQGVQSSLAPRNTGLPIAVSNQQYYIYCNSVGNCGCQVYTKTWTGSQYCYICTNLNSINNIVFAPYYTCCYAWQILNMSADMISCTTTGTPVRFTYTGYSASCGYNNYQLDFTICAKYDNNSYCVGDPVWGCYCTNPSWCNALLTLTGIKKNGSDYLSSYQSNNQDWETQCISNFKIFYPGEVLAINVASVGTLTTSNCLNIDNTNYSISAIDCSNNQITLFDTYNANVNLISSVATTNTYFSKYITECDLSLKVTNLGLTCVQNIMAASRLGTCNLGSCYVLSSDGSNPMNLMFRTIGLYEVVCNSNSFGCTMYGNFCTDSFSTCATYRETCCGFCCGTIVTCGGISVRRGIWANHVWANTALESKLVCTCCSWANQACANNFFSNHVTVPKQTVAYADSNWNCVAFFGLASTSPVTDSKTGCYFTSQNCSNPSACLFGNSTTVPPGATGYSICIPQYCYMRICNPNNINVFNGDFTVETWLQNPCNWPYWGYNLFSGQGQNSCIFACWSSGGCVKINNCSQMGFSCTCIYDAFWGYNGLCSTGWNHWAVSRTGTCLRWFLNGTMLCGVNTSSTNEASAATCYWVGYNNGLTASGYVLLYNYRVTAGLGRYTSNFTPALTPYGTSPTTIYAETANNAIDLYGGLKITNMCNVPADTYSDGGYLYVDGGALKYKGSGGTVTTLGSA